MAYVSIMVFIFVCLLSCVIIIHRDIEHALVCVLVHL